MNFWRQECFFWVQISRKIGQTKKNSPSGEISPVKKALIYTWLRFGR
jgi:hypothetical protein